MTIIHATVETKKILDDEDICYSSSGEPYLRGTSQVMRQIIDREITHGGAYHLLGMVQGALMGKGLVSQEEIKAINREMEVDEQPEDWDEW